MNFWCFTNLIIPEKCSWLCCCEFGVNNDARTWTASSASTWRKDVFSSYVDGAMTQCPRNVSHVTWRAWAWCLGRKALNWHYELGLDIAIVIVDQVATWRTRVSTSALVKTQTQIRTWSSQDQSIHDEWQVRRRHTAIPTCRRGCQLTQRNNVLNVDRWLNDDNVVGDVNFDINEFVDDVSGATTSKSYISLISWCEAAQHGPDLSG
jgi:hypothetical protein